MLAVEASLRAEGERQIKEGDVVIVYERHDRMKAVIVARNGELQNRFGVFPHNEWIGKPFGCRVVGKKGGGFVFLLAPTPELWTLVLPHRTQILYVADISFVISFLELRPGSVMLESGTGSGSLTHSLARAVAPSGHVHTFDFHEQRALAAKYVPIPLSLSLSLSRTHTHTDTEHLVCIQIGKNHMFLWPQENCSLPFAVVGVVMFSNWFGNTIMSAVLIVVLTFQSVVVLGDFSAISQTCLFLLLCLQTERQFVLQMVVQVCLLCSKTVLCIALIVM